MGVFLKYKTQMKKLSDNNNSWSISDISHLQQKYFNYYLNYSGILSELSEETIYPLVFENIRTLIQSI